jgi:hypothetical protein
METTLSFYLLEEYASTTLREKFAYFFYNLVINNLVRNNLTNLGRMYLEKTTIEIVKRRKVKIT